MADFTIRDNNTKLRITCLKRDGAFFNLTGHTIKIRFRIRNVDHAAAAMTIVDAVGGVAEYDMQTSSGITLILNNNNRLDVNFGGVITSLSITPGVYTNMQDIIDLVQTALITINSKFRATYDALTGLVSINNSSFSFDLLFATGPTILWTIRDVLGFQVMDYIGDPGYISTFPITAFFDTDLSEEGIMYAEFEITETSTGRLVSSSEISVFTVRGKVADD